MPDPITIIHDGRPMTSQEYTAATGRMAPTARTRRAAPTAAAPRSPTLSAEAIAEAERARISQILTLPAARANPKGAENLAFGSSATVAEAAAALARHADKKAAAREASAESMRKVAGLPPKNPKPLSASAISMLKTAANRGGPEQRKAAIAKLVEHGLNAQGR